MKKLLLITAILPLAACTTPKTMLKNEATGQIVECGGSATGAMVGGVIGYHIQKSNDDDCVTDYEKQGFTPIHSSEEMDEGAQEHDDADSY